MWIKFVLLTPRPQEFPGAVLHQARVSRALLFRVFINTVFLAFLSFLQARSAAYASFRRTSASEPYAMATRADMRRRSECWKLPGLIIIIKYLQNIK